MSVLCAMWMLIALIGDASGSPFLPIHRELTVLTAKRYPSVKEMDRMDRLFMECREKFPDEPAAIYWRAFQADRDNKPIEAQQLLRLCIKDADRSKDAVWDSIQVDAQVLWATLELSQGDSEAATRIALEVIGRDGRSVEAYRILIDAAFARGRLDEALPTLSKAVEQFRDDGAILETYLDLLAQMGRVDDLTQACRSRLNVDPLCPVAHYHLGEFGKERLLPTRRDAHLILAAINGSPRSLSSDRAEQRLGRIVYTDRDGAVRTGALAWDIVNRCEQRAEHDLALDDDEVAEAESAITAMSRDEPLLAVPRLHFEATLTLLQGDFQRAEKQFEQIVRDHPSLVPATCRLALLLESHETKSPRADEIKKLWADALRRSPRHPLLRQRFRLGLEVKLHPDGATVVSVSPESPLFELGIKTGDVLTSLADVSTTEGSRYERLLRIYHFSGGQIALRRVNGDQVTLDSSILLFD